MSLFKICGALRSHNMSLYCPKCRFMSKKLHFYRSGPVLTIKIFSNYILKTQVVFCCIEKCLGPILNELHLEFYVNSFLRVCGCRKSINGFKNYNYSKLTFSAKIEIFYGKFEGQFIENG